MSNDPLLLKPCIEKLDAKHKVDSFMSGSDALDNFLQRYALTNQKSGAAITYVAAIGTSIAGYYSLSVGDVAFADAPERLGKGLARHPIPIMLIARLAVHKDFQGKRFGSHLLRDALTRTLQASDIGGIRAVVTHAKDEQAKKFYEHYDFIPFTDEPLTLYRLIKDIRKIAAT